MQHPTQQNQERKKEKPSKKQQTEDFKFVWLISSEEQIDKHVQVSAYAVDMKMEKKQDTENFK